MHWQLLLTALRYYYYLLLFFVRTVHDLLGVIMEATLLTSVTIGLALLMMIQNKRLLLL